MKDKRRMRIVKGLIAVMTAAAVIFSLTACGADRQSVPDTDRVFPKAKHTD